MLRYNYRVITYELCEALAWAYIESRHYCGAYKDYDNIYWPDLRVGLLGFIYSSSIT